MESRQTVKVSDSNSDICGFESHLSNQESLSNQPPRGAIRVTQIDYKITRVSPRGKAADFDSVIPRVRIPPP